MKDFSRMSVNKIILVGVRIQGPGVLRFDGSTYPFFTFRQHDDGYATTPSANISGLIASAAPVEGLLPRHQRSETSQSPQPGLAP
jgi:hypothetical protein